MDFCVGDGGDLECLFNPADIERHRLAVLPDGRGQYRLDDTLLFDDLSLLLDLLRDYLLVAEILVVIGQVDILGVDGLPVHIQLQQRLFSGLILVHRESGHDGPLGTIHIHQQALEHAPLLAVLLPLPHAHPLLVGQAEVLCADVAGSVRRDGAGDGRPMPLGAGAIAVGHQHPDVLRVLAHHHCARSRDGRRGGPSGVDGPLGGHCGVIRGEYLFGQCLGLGIVLRVRLVRVAQLDDGSVIAQKGHIAAVSVAGQAAGGVVVLVRKLRHQGGIAPIGAVVLNGEGGAVI